MDLESQNQALLKSIPDLMFIINKDGVYTDYHASNPELLFAPPEAFLGKSVRDIMGPELSRDTMTHIKLAIKTGVSQSFHAALELSGEQLEFENRVTIDTGSTGRIVQARVAR